MTKAELEQCVEEYGKDIYSFCRQITGSEQEGEELYQDTFLKAMELLKRMDIQQNPRCYLLSVAVKLWKNKRRKYAWRQRIVPQSNIAEMTGVEGLETASCYGYQGSNNSCEAEILRREQQAYVHYCIDMLPEKLKLPVILYYAAELSVSEIAACLKIPAGTVKSRLYKARTMLKEQLEVAGYDR